MRDARRDKQIGPRRGPDDVAADVPFTRALQHIEGLFLHTMNVAARGNPAGMVQSNMLVCFVSSPVTKKAIG